MSLRRDDLLQRKIDIEKWIADHRPKAFICRELDCKPSTLDRYLKLMGLLYKGNAGAKGYKTSPLRKSVITFLYKGSLVNAHKLKLKIVANGLKARRCERCLRDEWLGVPIPIELHHINGDPFDNRIENLEILCPNCHALTENHAGKGARKRNATVGK